MFYKNIKDSNSTSFVLNPGERSSHLRIRDYGKNSFEIRLFTLYADKKDNKTILKLCKQTLQEEGDCRILESNQFKKWDKLYPQGNMPIYIDNRLRYNIYALLIDAVQLDDHSIKVNFARLLHPQYKLKISRK